VKEPAEPTVKVVLFALVMDGDWSTVKAKVCVAFGLTAWLAVIEME
jgi:hypothetical protein